MPIKLIPLSRPEADPQGTPSECLEPNEDDHLIDRLIESNPAFRAPIQKSKASPRKPFPTRPEE